MIWLQYNHKCYIGKEKEPENKLGDHGVRKYDYETGRFNSIELLWEQSFPA